MAVQLRESKQRLNFRDASLDTIPFDDDTSRYDQTYTHLNVNIGLPKDNFEPEEPPQASDSFSLGRSFETITRGFQARNAAKRKQLQQRASTPQLEVVTPLVSAPYCDEADAQKRKGPQGPQNLNQQQVNSRAPSTC